MKVCDLCRKIESPHVVEVFFGQTAAIAAGNERMIHFNGRIYALSLDVCTDCEKKLAIALAAAITEIHPTFLPKSVQP